MNQKSTLKGIYIFMMVILLFLFVHQNTFAQIQNNGNPDSMTQDPGTNDGVSANRMQEIRKKIQEAIRKRNAQAIGEIYYIFLGVPNTSITPFVSPVPLTVFPSLSPTSIFPTPTYAPPQPYLGQIRYYRQCSPENKNAVMRQGCTLCNAGCGITATATIASTLLNDPAYTPIRMLSIYKANNYYVQCDGTSIVDSFSFFKKLSSSGTQGALKIQTTNDYIFRGQAFAYHQAAPYIKQYTDAGWMIVMLAKFNNIGHFVVITNVDGNNNFTVYDPYYESNMTTQPNTNYMRYKTPDAIYRAAFGVKRIN